MFPLSTDTLAKLVDPKNPDLFKELGGLEGLGRDLHADLKRGLSPPPQEELDLLSENEVESRRVTKYAKNILPPPPQETLWDMIFGALQDKILLLLIGAAIISIVLGSIPETSEHPETGFIDGLAILIAVIIVVCVTSGNDFQKQRQFQKLNAKKNDRVVKCIRGGEQMQISVFDVRVGDILMVETGDIVCADGVFVSGHALKCDESAMTGESIPIKKGLIEDEADPFLISGSQVIEGVGNMLVIAVGINSFNGRTMMALRVPDEETPLQQKLEVLAGNIGKFGIIAAVLLLLIGIPKYFIEAAVKDVDMSSQEFKKKAGADVVKLIINAITIVVVAVPEGLPLAVTIALAYGMIKMLADNNLVRHLSACETMGGATNICSDKTGTLTQNVMTVVTAWVGGKNITEINERTKDQLPKDLKDALFQGIAMNSNAFEALNQKGVMDFVGSKTECALLKFGKLADYDYMAIREGTTIHQLYPFSSARKCMSTVVKVGEGHYRLYTKGASEIVLGMCNRVLVAAQNSNTEAEIIPLDQGLNNHLRNVITEYATDALRTLCMAYTDIHGEIDWSVAPENNMVLLAIVGIRDPLRPEVPEAVRVCQKAGITVRMVTGDNIVTAENIAKHAGILRPGGLCMEGPKFRELSVEQMDRVIPRLQVLARSSPTDKQLLVGRLKELGEVVAVTGDGTNDAPALKMADIGFSMGVSGTEVAIAASDVVLLDDNFASIVKAALWGRNIFNAIRKFLQFQLTVNVVAVTLAFIGTLSGEHGESPLTAVQLLWVNLIMDSLAALSLATEVPSPDLLNEKPTGRHAALITRKMWRFIFGHAIFQIAITFALLYGGAGIFGFDTSIQSQRTELFTIIFNTFVMMQLFNELNARMLKDEVNMFTNILKNRFFIIIMIITLILQVIFVELGGQFTSTVGLSYWEWFVCIGLGMVEVPYGILLRFIPIHEKRDEDKPDIVDDLSDVLEEDKPLTSGSIVLAPGQDPNKRKNKWTLVRRVVTQISVINAFKYNSVQTNV